MMRMALIAASLLATLVAGGAGVAFYLKPSFIFGSSDDTAPPPHGVPSYATQANEQTQIRNKALSLVEQLGAVQDRIIRGDRAALEVQSRLLSVIAHEVRSFDSVEWDDYVNRRTSLLFVLSGGDANVLKPLVERTDMNPVDQKLAAGVMNFAEGKPRQARQFFEDIDPRSLDVSLVGPFALARASLYLDDDHATAIDLLDDARLACPHTAINEAATRREIPILMKTGNAPRALMLTVSYIREFGKSIYARKLFRDLSEELAKHADLDNAAAVDRLVDALDDKDMQPASELFVDMAAEAILQGRLKLANAAANRVLRTSSASPENQERAQLYAAASDAPSDNAAGAMKALNQIAADRLSEDDTEIREVAGFIARAVAGGESMNRTLAAVSTPTNIPQGSSGIKAMKALGDADAALKEADSLISGGGR
ncbi:MAG: hypothetical protein ABWZ86_07840 [Hyphomicrobium sp.]